MLMHAVARLSLAGYINNIQVLYGCAKLGAKPKRHSICCDMCRLLGSRWAPSGQQL